MTRIEKIALCFIIAIFIPVGFFLVYRWPVLGVLGIALLGVIVWGALT